MNIARATLRAYYPATHTATVELADAPAVLLSLPVLMSCPGNWLTVGVAVMVQLWSDIGGVVIGPYGAVPTDWVAPNDVRIARDLDVDRNANVDGTLHATGATDTDSTLHADGNIDTDANILADGHALIAGGIQVGLASGTPLAHLVMSTANSAAAIGLDHTWSRQYSDNSSYSILIVGLPATANLYAELTISTHRATSSAGNYGAVRKYLLWFYRDATGVLQEQNIVELIDYTLLGGTAADTFTAALDGDTLTFTFARDHNATPSTRLIARLHGVAFAITSLTVA